MISHTALSRADLISIYFYNLAAYNEQHAERFLAFLNEEIDQLDQNPGLGKDVDGFRDLKVLLIQSKIGRGTYGYRVFFRLLPDAIEVIRVLHTSREID